MHRQESSSSSLPLLILLIFIEINITSTELLVFFVLNVEFWVMKTDRSRSLVKRMVAKGTGRPQAMTVFPAIGL